MHATSSFNERLPDDRLMQPEAKGVKKGLETLSAHFKYLAPRSNNSRSKGKTSDGEEFLGEYQSLMEQEFYDFVVFDVPWIVN